MGHHQWMKHIQYIYEKTHQPFSIHGQLHQNKSNLQSLHELVWRICEQLASLNSRHSTRTARTAETLPLLGVIFDTLLCNQKQENTEKHKTLRTWTLLISHHFSQSLGWHREWWQKWRSCILLCSFTISDSKSCSSLKDMTDSLGYSCHLSLSEKLVHVD